MAERVVTRKVRRYKTGEEWRVDWERANSKKHSTLTKFFQTWAGVENFTRKLLSDGRPDLEPIVFLEVRKRKVGPWRTDARWIIDAWFERYRQGERLTSDGWK